MPEKMSLSELQLVIRDSLYMALPDTYWIVAEISEIKENYSGHCYIDLVEKNLSDDNVKARAKGIIWGNRYRFLKSLFENVTGQPLREGIRILIRVKIEYHELYGLSLIISDIDPSFTIGELAVKRQQIIKKLEDEGVFGMNKELPLPAVPQRIAIISSANAAGYTDFVNHLTGNSYGYQYYMALFDTAMQGPETEEGVINALDRIASFINNFDIVVIIRGGGAQSDLSWFDNYNIAYHITQFPLPVLTGIGHDKDMSVTDLVACRSLKTPTAVADFLVDSAARYENQILELSSAIKETSRMIINENMVRLDTAKTKIVYSAKSVVTGKNISLTASRQRLVTSSISFIKGIDQRITGLNNALDLIRPERVLKRGYTLTTRNGKILKSSNDVNEEDMIDTVFVDGTISSVVNGNKIKDKSVKTKV
jgi:exodeoxyribonuclease VII large subunit